MITIIIPFYNEAENLPILFEELCRELKKTKEEFEILFIDDGSTDNGGAEVKAFTERHSFVRTFSKIRRTGKGEALATGVRHAKGNRIFFMDGDLQNDPKDIPLFLEKLDQGYDFVNSIRKERKDNALIQIYSKSAAMFLHSMLHSPFTDINSPFKAMKREIFDEISLYANNFRFLPLAAYYKGFKVAEVPVENRPRRYGKSKFGISKLFIGVLDTLTAFFLYKFAERPLHFFGMIGGSILGIGTVWLLWLTFERIFFHILLYRRPVLMYAILLIIVGIQIIMTGFIGELIVYLHKRK